MSRQPDSGHSRASASRDPGALRLLEAAVAHHRAGRLPQALQTYQEILVRWPDQADAHNLKGLALYQSGKLQPALDSIDAYLDAEFKAWVQQESRS